MPTGHTIAYPFSRVMSAPIRSPRLGSGLHPNLVLYMPFSSTLKDYISGQYLTLNRSGELVYLGKDSTYKTASDDHPAIGKYGVFTDGAGTQYFVNPNDPVTQTINLGSTGDYCLWVSGSGSATVAADTATIDSGGEATDGSYVTFEVTDTGTVDVTISGDLDWCQLEDGTFPSSRIYNDGTLPGTTISRTLCLKLTSGDDSTSGTGEIILDWTNISDKADIVLYDENDNLLDYYFESFDATNETAVVWVYRDWKVDGSTQVKIVYGNGSSDQSVDASTVFSKESDLAAAYLFNETSGDLKDVSGNGNDGTVYGATQGEEGIVGGAYSFDGNDDNVDVGGNGEFNNSITITGELTLSYWINPSRASKFRILNAENYAQTIPWHIRETGLQVDNRDVGGYNEDIDLDTSIPTDSWTHLFFVKGSDGYITVYINGEKSNTNDAKSEDDFKLANIGYNTGDTSWLPFEGLTSLVCVYSTELGEEIASAFYDTTKSSPDFFSQQSAVELENGQKEKSIVVPWESTGSASRASQASDASDNGLSITLSNLNSRLETALASEGAAILQLRPEFDYDVNTSDAGLISFNDSADDFLFYNNGVLKFTDGTNTATYKQEWSKGDQFWPVVKWGGGELVVGVYDGSSISWGTAQSFEGSFPKNTDLRPFFGNELPQWAGGLKFFDKAPSDDVLVREASK